MTDHDDCRDASLRHHRLGSKPPSPSSPRLDRTISRNGVEGTAYGRAPTGEVGVQSARHGNGSGAVHNEKAVVGALVDPAPLFRRRQARTTIDQPDLLRERFDALL